ncbi:MAG: PqqD family protein, partial [Acidobacteria bacterium]|nr:PqqD family protein [Acidobacteriota bacterium]
MKPESRKEQLIAQEVGQELVVYDQQTQTAHRLNRTAALVWRLSDGQRTTADLAKLLHDTTDAPEDEDLVRLALEELDKSGLLASHLPKLEDAITRRRLFSLGATLIPVVASVAAPSAQSTYTPWLGNVAADALKITIQGAPNPPAIGVPIAVAITTNSVNVGDVKSIAWSDVPKGPFTDLTLIGLAKGSATVSITKEASGLHTVYV